MRIDILSLFPSYFAGPFDVSIIKRAKEAGIIDVNLIDMRKYTQDKHGKVDDRPFGGGPGMVLMAQPVCDAIQEVRKEGTHVVYLSPQGKVLTQAICERLAALPHIVLLCGHYEGVDERIIELEVDEEISIGDYVLTSGCPAAAVLLDSVVRLLPGVLGNEESAVKDSFQQGIFDAPQYTRPRDYKGLPVPPVLLEGNHAEIEKWRLKNAKDKTARVRPELI